jgi:hypothetical protein
VVRVPTVQRVRATPCTGCGDTVLVIERRLGRMLGMRLKDQPAVRLEHADPGPDGEVFDGVDGACRRPRVR